MSNQPRPEVLRRTADIVAAHLGHNQVAAEALPGLINAVYQALSNLGAEPEAAPAARPEPAVPVRKSVFPDYIVCLEDGARMTMLKRYLQVRFGLTPAAYRQRWGLPADYPMVAPNYTEKRSALARQIGLGRKQVAPQPDEAPAPAEPKPEPEARGGAARKPAKPRARRTAAPAA